MKEIRMRDEVARAAGTEKRAVHGLILYGGASLPAVMSSETCVGKQKRAPLSLLKRGALWPKKLSKKVTRGSIGEA